MHLEPLLWVNVEMDLHGVELVLGERLVGGVHDNLFHGGKAVGGFDAHDDALDIQPADSAYTWVFRSQHSGVEPLAQGESEVGGGGVEQFLLAVAQSYLNEFAERGITEHTTLHNLRLEHACVVVVHDVADGLMPGVIGLDDNLALMAVASGATGHLHHLLETTFK